MSTRLVGSVGLCLLLLLAGPRPLAAQLAAQNDALSTQSFPAYHLLPEDSAASWTQPYLTTQLLMDAPPQVEADLPRWEFLERHQRLFSILIPVTSVGGVMANSLIGYDKNHSLEIHHEGFFGRNTTNGGADKASHLTDYFIVANLFEDVYRMLGTRRTRQSCGASASRSPRAPRMS
jgi:hypothetical protein